MTPTDTSRRYLGGVATSGRDQAGDRQLRGVAALTALRVAQELATGTAYLKSFPAGEHAEVVTRRPKSW